MDETKYISKKRIKKINILFDILSKITKTRPYIVILILHELYRNLYNEDKYIPFKVKNPVQRFDKLIVDLINFANSSNKIGFYKTLKFENITKNEIKSRTGKVYGPLWKDFQKKDNLEAIGLLKKRISRNIFKNKKVLDDGCGGGRYSNAIATMGAKEVIGIDYGDQGLKVAKLNYKKTKNLKFKKMNVLNLNFKDNTFDVVFSNGVLHHTTNYKKGIEEAVRVCKKGGKIWLYLYSVGGLFWYSRKLMNKLMKEIDYEYTSQFLRLINLPKNRFIFMDNWYVPIEKHCSHKDILKILKKLKVSKVKKITTKNKFDLEYALKNNKNSQEIWGEGEIRFLITK